MMMNSLQDVVMNDHNDTLSPATQALEKALKDDSLSSFVAKPKGMSGTEDREPPGMISSKNLKRSRSCMATFDDRFDMDSFWKASRDVEESILFPPIDWPSAGEDEDVHQELEDVERDREVAEPTPKRRCRGLVRSKNSSDLSSLAGSAGRYGSNGSMC
mmetsp:Transcript_12450/g.21800  ORF Transcript_12450/g.21800 Transcript_12450/m.21800 type:complete len:159 (-) Transcript_12450:85-561(-)